MDEFVGLLVVLGLALLVMPVLLIVVMVSLSGLKARVASLEAGMAALRQAPRPAATSAASPGAAPPADVGREPTLADLMAARAAPGVRSSPPMPEETPPPASTPAPAPAPAATGTPPAAPPPLPAAARTGTDRRATASASPGPRPVHARGPDAGDAVLRAVKRWFTVGNLPAKVGMLVMFAGVAALLKYASDQGLFELPLELRLAGVAAAALAALGFAWRKRQSNRTFALSLQGGAVGVLLLTVFAASRLYGMLPAGAAFALSVLLVAGMALLAVLQDARALAVLAVFAGFLAPVWLSTGGGSHVALFSYYALLNAAIVAIAWFKAWRILNLLGFVSTFGIGTLWGVLDYSPDKYATAQPFLLLFFAFYLAVPLLFARRRPEGRRDLVDGCLVFGTPLIAFILQAGLLDSRLAETRLPLALCAVGLGALYAGLAWALLRRAGLAVLGQSYAILAVGFATLAVPLALSARATASIFALEGAGLVWLGLRRQRWMPQVAGIGLQVLAAFALAIGLAVLDSDTRAILNPTAMGMLLIALAGLASAWAARAHDGNGRAVVFYLWGLAWWVGNGLHETARFVDAEARPDALLAFAALTAWIAALVQGRRPAAALAWTVAAAFAVALPLLLWQDAVHVHPFGGGYGALSWVAFALLGLHALWCLRDDRSAGAGMAQFVWWLLWPLALMLSARWLAGEAGLAEGWRLAMAAVPWLAAGALALWRWPWLALPRTPEVASALRAPLLWVVLAVIGMGWLAALARPASSAPLPWVPLLNPTELAQCLALVLGAAWLWAQRGLAPVRSAVVALGGFVLLSVSTLRTVHHWGGIAWTPDLLSTSLAQTSLTVVWSVLGVIGWVAGSRGGRRGLWLGGALLMGVVLAKLVLVDRQHLGNLLGIVSFIAYGMLCTIVGYLAPAPPRMADTEESRA